MGIFLVGSLIQTIITVNDDSYTSPAWQCTLLAFAAMFIAYGASVYGTTLTELTGFGAFADHTSRYRQQSTSVLAERRLRRPHHGLLCIHHPNLGERANGNP